MKKTLPKTAAPAPPAPARRPSRLAALALVAAALTLGASLLVTLLPRAHSAGGPVAVQVANAPLATQDSSLAGSQPYQKGFSFFVPDGEYGGNGSLTVPAGKRLVIETVSAQRVGGTAQETQSVEVTTTAGGSTGNTWLPQIPPTNAAYPASTLSARLYADPGSAVTIQSIRDRTSGGETLNFNVSGYLVNAP